MIDNGHDEGCGDGGDDVVSLGYDDDDDDEDEDPNNEDDDDNDDGDGGGGDVDEEVWTFQSL